MQLVHQLMMASSLRHPNAQAIICDNERLSYDELLSRVNLLADLFVIEGLLKGDRVLVLLRNKVEFIVASFAIMRAGGIAVPIPEDAASNFVEQVNDDCRPLMVITSNDDLVTYPLLRDKLTCRFVFMQEAIHRPNLLTEPEPSRPSAPRIGEMIDHISKLMNLEDNDGALLLYSPNENQGLTSRLFSHRNITQVTRSLIEQRGGEPPLREFVVLPLTNFEGFQRVCSILAEDGIVVLRNHPMDGMRFTQTILNQRCTAFSISSELISQYIRHIDTWLQHVESLVHSITICGKEFSAENHRRLLEIFSHSSVYVHYCHSCAPLSTTLELHQFRGKAGSAGHHTAYAEIEIHNLDGAACPPGQPGEIWIRGSHVPEVNICWRDPHTLHAAYGNSWVKTWEIGYLDEEDFLHRLGNVDDTVTTGSSAIIPQDVEEKFRELYPTCEACIVNVPNPTGVTGDVVILCYRQSEETPVTPSEVAAKLAHCFDRQRLPHMIYQVSSLPKVGGRVSWAELRLQITDGTVAARMHIVSPT